MDNVSRLGLEEHYGPHPDGIEIKDQELYTKAAALQDIFRADLIHSDKLNNIDRFQALAEAARYVREVHKRSDGGIGELLSNDILFKDKSEDGTVSNAVLNLPDIVYNETLKQKLRGYEQSDTAKSRDQQATDLLDFMFNIGVEEYRRSQEWDEVKKALRIILENYQDKKIIELLKSFAKRGRLTLIGDREALGDQHQPDAVMSKAQTVFGQHNRARLGTRMEFEGFLRQTVIDACGEFLSSRTEVQGASE